MKIHILCKLKEGAWGGGNQFLKALRYYFEEINIYTENVDDADIIIFNSFPFGEEYRFKQIYNLKKQGKILVHRIDGPIFKVRNKDLIIDKIIYKFNNLFADGTVFQSNWSKKENYNLGLKKNNFEITILNAPDATIFNKNNRINFSRDKKIKLIATSWSNNMRKGFDIYQYLDENLDFSKYEMTFIGNSPTNFKNIKWVKPLNSKELALQLKQNDIFITASQKDPCSNSLIEALHCGLPAVVLNDGGHPEIIGNAGETFNNKEDCLGKIEKVANNYENYEKNIRLPNIDEVSGEYYKFTKNIFNKFKNNLYTPKKIDIVQLYSILFLVFYGKIINKIKHILNKCTNKI